jgi:hypothetical protein
MPGLLQNLLQDISHLFSARLTALASLTGDRAAYFAALGLLTEAFICLWLHAALHELGHFSACRALGRPPGLVNIWAADFRFRFWPETTFRIGPVPFGFTGDPERPRALHPSPAAQILVSLGGIGATGALTAAALLLARAAGSVLKPHLALFGAAGAALFALNLFDGDVDGARIRFALSRLGGKPWPEEPPRLAGLPVAVVIAKLVGAAAVGALALSFAGL